MPTTALACPDAPRIASSTVGQAFQVIRSRAWVLLAGIVVAVVCFPVLQFHPGMARSVAIPLVLSFTMGMAAGAALASVLPVAALMRDVSRSTARQQAGHEAIARW